MKPSQRWAIAIAVVVAIGLIWLLWGRRGQEPVPVKGEIAAQPAAPRPEPKAEPPAAPVTPRAEEPVSATVLFDYNRSDLRPAEAPKLDGLAAKLQGRTFDRLEAVGHADRIGSDAYNTALSKRRAEAVAAYLTGKGVDAQRIRAEARGEQEPVTGEACLKMGPENRGNKKLIECLQRDRRVEVRLAATR